MSTRKKCLEAEGNSEGHQINEDEMDGNELHVDKIMLIEFFSFDVKEIHSF